MRPALLVMLLAVSLAAGCGGERSSPATPAEVVDALVEASAAGDVSELLTASSRGHAPELAQRLRRFEAGHRVVLDSRVEQWAVVGVADEGTRHAAAVVLRREEGEWRAEVTDAIDVEPTGPRPGAVQSLVVQVAAEVKGHAAPLGPTAMWLDDQGLDLKGATSEDGKTATVFANLTERVGPGRHVVVAFATAGNTATALGWAFGVPGP